MLKLLSTTANDLKIDYKTNCNLLPFPDICRSAIKNKTFVLQPKPGLPDFSWYKIPIWEKLYQITTNFTKYQ
jgi:hypothetical protein